MRSAAKRSAHQQRDLRINGDERSGVDIAPIEMAGHVQVIKLVAKITVVPDAGEDVQQQLGGAESNQNARCKRRKRRNPRSIVIGARQGSAGDSHPELCSSREALALSFPTLFQNVFAESSRIVTGPSFTSSTCIIS